MVVKVMEWYGLVSSSSIMVRVLLVRCNPAPAYSLTIELLQSHHWFNVNRLWVDGTAQDDNEALDFDD